MKIERSEIPGKFVAIPIGRFTREWDEDHADETLHLTDEESLALADALSGFFAAELLAMLGDAHGKPGTPIPPDVRMAMANASTEMKQVPTHWPYPIRPTRKSR